MDVLATNRADAATPEFPSGDRMPSIAGQPSPKLEGSSGIAVRLDDVRGGALHRAIRRRRKRLFVPGVE
jgi:hypothetical protein